MSMSRFGNIAPTASASDSPLTFCLVDSMDSKFLHGGTASTSGPRSRQCQTFMAERCAANWDGFCDYFYREHTAGSSWPDGRVWPNLGTPNQWGNRGASSLSLGDQLLKNAAERRYCTFPTCVPHQEPFDHMNPQSPMITSYRPRDGGSDGCVPVCRVNPATVNHDVLMKRMLQNPAVCSATLINACNTAKREGTDLSGTDIGKFCEQYDKIASNKVDRAYTLTGAQKSSWQWPCN
jgi:hypothetical protein